MVATAGLVPFCDQVTCSPALRALLPVRVKVVLPSQNTCDAPAEAPVTPPNAWGTATIAVAVPLAHNPVTSHLNL